MSRTADDTVLLIFIFLFFRVFPRASQSRHESESISNCSPSDLHIYSKQLFPTEEGTPQGSVTYKTNNKKVTVKSGTMTVAKGLKKGKTYKVKITVTAKGNNNYKSQKVVKTIKIKVK